MPPRGQCNSQRDWNRTPTYAFLVGISALPTGLRGLTTMAVVTALYLAHGALLYAVLYVNSFSLGLTLLGVCVWVVAGDVMRVTFFFSTYSNRRICCRHCCRCSRRCFFLRRESCLASSSRGVGTRNFLCLFCTRVAHHQSRHFQLFFFNFCFLCCRFRGCRRCSFLALRVLSAQLLWWCQHRYPPVPGGSVRRVRGWCRLLRRVQVLSVIRVHAHSVVSMKPSHRWLTGMARS